MDDMVVYICREVLDDSVVHISDSVMAIATNGMDHSSLVWMNNDCDCIDVNEKEHRNEPKTDQTLEFFDRRHVFEGISR